MIDFIPISGKAPPAVLTLIRLLTSVSTDVVSKTGFLRESFPTASVSARIGQDSHVDISMSRKGGLRFEGLAAEGMGASVNFFNFFAFCPFDSGGIDIFVCSYATWFGVLLKVHSESI